MQSKKNVSILNRHLSESAEPTLKLRNALPRVSKAFPDYGFRSLPKGEIEGRKSHEASPSG